MPSVVMDQGKSNNSPDSGQDDPDEFDFSKLLHIKPRLLNIDRQTSCDERSLHEHSNGIGIIYPLVFKNPESNSSRLYDHPEIVSTPGKRSAVNTPKAFNNFELHGQHPMMDEGWDALKQSLVYFRGQPVGTIAALDHSEEALNYNQNLVMQHVDHSAGDLIDLLQGLLRYDPAERLKAREALQHPFFNRDNRRIERSY